jgi:uncharacterized protein DUF6789
MTPVAFSAGPERGLVQNFNPKKAIWAGLVATLAMTLAAYAAPFLGLARIDFAALLGSLFTTGSPPALSVLWWSGMIIHFLNGTFIFSLVYARLVVFHRSPGEPWLRRSALGRDSLDCCSSRGHAAFRYGVFLANAPRPALWLVAGLIAHLIYGTVLGAVAGEQATPLPGTERFMAHSREHEHDYLMRNKLQRKG